MKKHFTTSLLTLLAAGLGTFAHAQITTSAFTLSTKLSPNSSIKSCVLEDFDGDGKKDLAMSNGAVTGNIFIYPGSNVISGVIDSSTFGSKITLDALTTPSVMAAADVNADGKMDLIVGHWNVDQVSVFTNTSTSGNISFANHIDFSAGAAYPSEVKCADFDGDSLPDIVVSCFGSQEAFVLLNAFSGSMVDFVPANSITLAGGYPGASYISDFNNDGKMDIAFTLYDDTLNALQVFRNTSALGSPDFTADAKITVGMLPQNVEAGDINKDGKMDVVVLNSTSSTLSVLENNSTMGSSISFKTPITITPSGYGTLTGCSAKDLNGDGYGDITVSGTTASPFGIYMNKGNAGAISTTSFYSKVDFTVPHTPNGVWVNDIDGDHHPDLVISSDNDAYVFRNSQFASGLSFISHANAVINAYPNPVKDQLEIELPASVTKATVQVSDVTGKSFGSFSYVNGQKLDVSSLTKGIYILRVQSETQTYSGKIVKE